jgi:ParB family chromosome partitioning protein
MAFSLSERLKRQASGESPSRFDPIVSDGQSLSEVPIDQIEPDPNQPRKDLGNLEGLSDSISEHGLLSPIIVECLSRNRYRIIAGERRYTACKKSGLKTIPCLVRSVEEHKKLEIQLVENLHRKDLHPIEEALSYKRLLLNHGLGQRELSRRVGKSASGINQCLRILDLPSDILENAQKSDAFTKSVLLEIAKEPNSGKQRLLWKQAESGRLSVRSAKRSKKKKTNRNIFHIHMEEGTVSLRFKGNKTAVVQDRILILEKALNQIKVEVSSLAENQTEDTSA